MPDLKALGLAIMINPRYLSLAIMTDSTYLGMTNMSDLTNNKQRGQLCTLVVRREKRIKKNINNQSRATIQLLFIYIRHTMSKRA
jgi:hypothetical protein